MITPENGTMLIHNRGIRSYMRCVIDSHEPICLDLRRSKISFKTLWLSSKVV